ncbi:MAG TPA: VCBS repeat-containing protein, partial [Myxococcota bacterium]|nr:VCBS repeat-containing protein [Myxococcota bacterium]
PRAGRRSLGRWAGCARGTLLLSLVGCEGPAEDSGTPLKPGELQQVATRSCPAPGPLSWRDRAEEFGLEGTDHAVDHFEGGAVALDDVDADGTLDLVLAMPASPVRLYPALGSGRASEIVGGMAPMAFLRWDVDEDGGADLVITGPMPSLLMRRQGHYEEEQLPGFDLSTLVALHGSSVLKQLVPFDADQDGDLDLYGPVNPGSGTVDPESVDDVVLFREGPLDWRTVELPAVLAGTRPFDAAVVDRNGVDALYVANDMGAQFGGNQLFVGSAEGVEDITEDCGCGLVESAMADEVADVNADGLEDIVIGSTFRSLLLLDTGDGRYVDASASTGVSKFPDGRSMSWAVSAEDFDNDGRMDIVIPQGDFRPQGGGDIYESPINALWQR